MGPGMRGGAEAGRGRGQDWVYVGGGTVAVEVVYDSISFLPSSAFGANIVKWGGTG